MEPINHWTSEQDKRQLEIWSDKHPVLSGCITLCAIPFYALLIIGGIVVILAMNFWNWLHWFPKGIIAFIVVGGTIVFCFYWVLYAGLWLCGKLLL